MRTVSAATLEAMLSQSTDEVILTTLKISHPDLPEDLCFVNDKRQLIFEGDTYVPAAFDFRLPDDVEDNVPRGQITIDNTDRQIIEAVKTLQVAPDMQFNLVLAPKPPERPDPVREYPPIDFKLQEFSSNAHAISGRLGYAQDFLNEIFPKNTFNPRTARGIF